MKSAQRLTHRLADWRLGLLLLLSGVGLLIGLRVVQVRAAYGDSNGCRDCFDIPVVGNDLMLLVLLALALALASLVRPGKWRWPWLALSWLLISAYAVDLGIFRLLNQRLLVNDLYTFGTDITAIWGLVRPVLASPFAALYVTGVSLALVGSALALATVPSDRRTRTWLPMSGAALAIATAATPDPGYVQPDAYLDFLRTNLPSGVRQAYSPAFTERIASLPPQAMSCQRQPAASPKSIILIIVESLSLHHSHLLSGLAGMVPGLDELARNNSYLEEFHANGYSTDGGTVALLLGQVPIRSADLRPHWQWYSSGYSQSASPLAQLNTAGYATEYFGSADLGFLDTGKWLTAIGFQHIEGPEHPSYGQIERGAFNDPGDEALYKRYLAWSDERGHTPHFTVLQTATTHPPFWVPGSLESGERQAFAYADRALVDLVDQLRQRNYFSNGIVIITGDHRAMTPIRADERTSIGPGTESRLPAILIGATDLPKGAIKGRWQQTDLLPSVLSVAGLTSCVSDFEGRFLGADRHPARYVLHARGSNRDQLRVWVAGETKPYMIELAGDDTGWVGTPPPGGGAGVIDFVNRTRIVPPQHQAGLP